MLYKTTSFSIIAYNFIRSFSQPVPYRTGYLNYLFFNIINNIAKQILEKLLTHTHTQRQYMEVHFPHHHCRLLVLLMFFSKREKKVSHYLNLHFFTFLLYNFPAFMLTHAPYNCCDMRKLQILYLQQSTA